ncbi:MoaD/ThiS family protein [Alisedimentitalea sp. MJ-SS2]|uniref:MoaD/ThiS family protein n=1 Tax=Aliisedimentitalea sp. MJ-SS2 TaxID=3049795 RepID=UPI0029136470|nr:MoaD/ThiS family protein [Alisedimentitalea sp. MJ-SS2]MDU8927422.1 MoaD/ThiS family protein [Alisedimentitalea sp. MJ-SS2]
MVAVRLWGSLGEAAGATEVEVQASNLRELLLGLEENYPVLRSELERGISVSIDGKIYNDSWATPIAPDSEVVLLTRLVGG